MNMAKFGGVVLVCALGVCAGVSQGSAAGRSPGPPSAAPAEVQGYGEIWRREASALVEQIWPARMFEPSPVGPTASDADSWSRLPDALAPALEWLKRSREHYQSEIRPRLVSTHAMFKDAAVWKMDGLNVSALLTRAHDTYQQKIVPGLIAQSGGVGPTATAPAPSATQIAALPLTASAETTAPTSPAVVTPLHVRLLRRRQPWWP